MLCPEAQVKNTAFLAFVFSSFIGCKRYRRTRLQTIGQLGIGWADVTAALMLGRQPPKIKAVQIEEPASPAASDTEAARFNDSKIS